MSLRFALVTNFISIVLLFVPKFINENTHQVTRPFLHWYCLFSNPCFATPLLQNLYLSSCLLLFTTPVFIRNFSCGVYQRSCCSLGRFSMLYIFCRPDQLVTLSKIYIIKLQHSKPKKCSRNGYVLHKAEQRKCNKNVFFVTLNYCVVCSFKIIWFGAQCYFHKLVTPPTKVKIFIFARENEPDFTKHSCQNTQTAGEVLLTTNEL